MTEGVKKSRVLYQAHIPCQALMHPKGKIDLFVSSVQLIVLFRVDVVVELYVER